MHWKHLLYRFDFNDDGIFHDEVDAVIAAKIDIFVSREQVHLPRETNPAQTEFMDGNQEALLAALSRPAI